MSDKFFVGLDLTSAEDNGIQRPISRVTLLLDDENSITAGDDTGMELLADCPHATQAMADAILAQVKGYQYQMFDADDAALDPSAELGDGVTAGSLYSVISRLDDDGSGYSGISAPGESELEDEYPASGPMTQAFNRKIAQTNSRITKTAEEIRLEVTNEMEGLSSSIDIKLDGITQQVTGLNGQMANIQLRVDGVSQMVTGLGGSVSTLEQTVSGLSFSVSSVSGEVGSLKYTIDGLTVTDASGTTKINGSSIETSTLRVNSIYGTYVYLRNNYGGIMGWMSITGADTASAAVELSSNGALRLKAETGAAYMEASSYGRYIHIQDMIYTRGPLVSNNVSSLGTSGYPWSDVYANNATIQASDLSIKKDIKYGLDDYNALFDALKPMSFVFTNGESGRRHLGVGAQDVEEAMREAGISSMNFAGFIKSPKEGAGAFSYALRYGEFIPLCIEQIQRLKFRVSEMERRLQ